MPLVSSHDGLRLLMYHRIDQVDHEVLLSGSISLLASLWCRWHVCCWSKSVS
jgi:hypothetical protein